VSEINSIVGCVFVPAGKLYIELFPSNEWRHTDKERLIQGGGFKVYLVDIRAYQVS
jgi:hypothetical protein